MSRVIWNRSDNPTEYVSETLGITRGQLRAALHLLKRAANLGPTDQIVIYGDGRVTDVNGDDIGNINDELTND